MADPRRVHESRSGTARHDRHSLAVALRCEARAERPRFSPALHEGVLAALEARVAQRPTTTRHRRPAGAGLAGGIAAAAACVAIAVATVQPRLAQAPAVPATAAAGIERLPTPEEIGASVFTQVATLAALAVGVPELPDLTALDPTLLATTDDPRP